MSGPGCEPSKQDYDFSKIPYPGALTHFPPWEIAVKATLAVIVELVAIIGNVLVITIVIRFRRMRTTTNYYLVNLAISDLLVVCLPVWIHVVDSLNDFWVLGSFLCKFSPFMQITAMCSSMFTLMVIAWDRFFAIVFPMRSRMTRRRVSLVLIVVWVAAIAISTPLLFMYFYMERRWLDVFETYCDEKWPMKSTSDGKCDYGLASKKAYWIVVCCVLNWTPMICMMIAYAVIVIKLRMHNIVPKLGASCKSTIQQKSKRRVVMMLFLVFIVFIVCSVPFQTIKIYFLFTQGELGYKMPDWYPTLNFAFVLLMYSNAAINPIIYGGMNQSFRNGFKDLVNGIIHRKRQSGSDYESAFSTRSVIGHDSTMSRDNGGHPVSTSSRRNANGFTRETANGHIPTIAETTEHAVAITAVPTSIETATPDVECNDMTVNMDYVTPNPLLELNTLPAIDETIEKSVVEEIEINAVDDDSKTKQLVEDDQFPTTDGTRANSAVECIELLVIDETIARPLSEISETVDKTTTKSTDEVNKISSIYELSDKIGTEVNKIPAISVKAHKQVVQDEEDTTTIVEHAQHSSDV